MQVIHSYRPDGGAVMVVDALNLEGKHNKKDADRIEEYVVDALNLEGKHN